MRLVSRASSSSWLSRARCCWGLNRLASCLWRNSAADTAARQHTSRPTLSQLCNHRIQSITKPQGTSTCCCSRPRCQPYMVTSAKVSYAHVLRTMQKGGTPLCHACHKSVLAPLLSLLLQADAVCAVFTCWCRQPLLRLQQHPAPQHLRPGPCSQQGQTRGVIEPPACSLSHSPFLKNWCALQHHTQQLHTRHPSRLLLMCSCVPT